MVRDAAGWLKGYVGRYVDVNAPLVSDFDELYDHFSNPIEFPLHRSRTVLWILLASRPTSIGTDSRSRTAGVLVDQTRTGVHFGSGNIFLGGVSFESVTAGDVIKLAVLNDPTGLTAQIDELHNRLAALADLPDGVVAHVCDDLRQAKEAVFRSDRRRGIERLNAVRVQLLQARAASPAVAEGAAKLDILIAAVAAG